MAISTAACATQTRPLVPAGAEVYPAAPGAQTYVATAGDVTGTVVRVDPAANVIVMDDGRMWQVAGDSMVLVDNQRAEVATLRPGSRVVMRSARPVTVRDGQYVVIQQPGAASTTVAAGPAATTVTTAPGTAATVTTSPYTGTVVRIDEGQRVLVFDDGRMWQTAGDSMVLVDGQPRVIGSVQPGTRVTVSSGYPVEYRDGRYVQLMPSSTATAAPVGVRQTVWGKVTDVDRDGEVTIKTDKGEFEVRMSPAMLSSIKKGDTVQVDITIPAAPSAAPRMR